jgi:integrase/recombinase XerD
VLKGPRRRLPLSAEGLDEILAGARRRAGLEHATCHELRHTCLTRLKGAELHRMQHSGPGVSTAP